MGAGSAAGTPRVGNTPRGGATPRGSGLAAGGMAVMASTPRGQQAQEAAAATAAAAAAAAAATAEGKPLTMLEEVCLRDNRLRVMVRAGKTPQERFGKQVLSSHKLGWGNSLEKFGVNHYGKVRNHELWPEP